MFIKEGKWEMKEEVRKMRGIKREKCGEKVGIKRGGVQVKMKKRIEVIKLKDVQMKGRGEAGKR